MKTIIIIIFTFLCSVLLADSEHKQEKGITKEFIDQNNIGIGVILSKNKFMVNETIDVNIYINNKSKDPITYFKSIYYHQVHVSVLNKNTGKEASKTAFGEKAVNSPVFGMSSITIAAGDKYSFVYNLSKIYDLSIPGAYLLLCRTEYHSNIQKGTILIEINDIEFNVVQPNQ